MPALAVLFLAAACGVADLATDVEPQLRGCGPAPQDGFRGTCWWAEEDIILRDGAGEAIMGPTRGFGGPRVPSDRFSVLGRYEEEFGGKALWVAVSAYNGERLPAGLLDILETTETPCVPWEGRAAECVIVTGIHEDSPSAGDMQNSGPVPIKIELYVNDAMPTPTPTAVPTAAPSAQSVEDAELSRGVQSPREALAQDLALVAEARGWTIEEAVADRKAADIVGRIAVQVAAERPLVFVGAMLSPEPGGAPELYIKGSADEFVRGLVAGAEIEVKIVDGQPFSFDELEERSLRVHRALAALGFDEISTGSSVTGRGEIEAEVVRRSDLPSDASEIVLSLPIDLQASVVLTVRDAHVGELKAVAPVTAPLDGGLARGSEAAAE